MNLKSIRGALTLTVLSGLVLGIAPAAFSQCVDLGVGASYNVLTREVAPTVAAKCKVNQQVYADPFVQFNKGQTSYGLGLNYKFDNNTKITPVAGLGIQFQPSTRTYGKAGFSYQTPWPVILDVNLKVPLDTASLYGTEITGTVSAQF